jgi:Putative beta-barrel porin-2, OmpL-like. bbp2
MRSALWGALFWSVAARAAAQGVPVTFEESAPVAISGFAVGTAGFDRITHSNSFAAGKVALSFFKPAGDAYVFGQLTTSIEDGETGTEIDNLIVSWTPHTASRWTLAFGRFDAPLGFERDDEPLNLIPTNSFNFVYARPSKVTGAIVRFTASPTLQLTAAAANGWDLETDNNRGKTAMLRAEWQARPGLTLGLAGVYGPERDSTDAHQRSLLSADVTFDAGRLILGAEFNIGREQEQPANLAWAGGALTGFLRLARSVGIAARYDHVDDSDGALTGTGQVLRSVTVGPMWFFQRAQEGIFANIEHTTFHLPQIAVRAALRVDYSTEGFFPNDQGGFERRNTRGVIELLYLF